MQIEKLKNRHKAQMEIFKEKELYKSEKKKFRDSLKNAWMFTMTKKVTWICLFAGILDLIYIQALAILSSPNILNLDSNVVTSHTEFCGKLWIGVIATILAYFVRGFADSYSISKNGDVSESNLKEKAEEFFEEIKEKI